MSRRRLADVDLNLLVALDALLRARSVTKAAKQLGVGQPAMSGALARLRALFDDPLLVRSSRGMELTKRAEELREPLGDVLGRIEQALSPAEQFAPAAATNTFRLCCTDYLELVLLPALCARIRAEARGVCLELQAVGDHQVAEELAAGRIDLALSVPRDTPAGIYRQVLFHDRLVCLVRNEHPRIGKELSAEAWAAEGHVLVSPRGRGKGPIDRDLAERGLERRIVVRTAHFLVAPAVAARTDLVATVTERLARVVAPQLGLRILEMPVPRESIPLVALWHERVHRDPAHRWLRRLLGEAAMQVRGVDPPSPLAMATIATGDPT
jgi:DNA-binding transcriptional LysR family regulator